MPHPSDGVKIELIVRGACCLRPGVRGCPKTSRFAPWSADSLSTAGSIGSATTVNPKFTAPALTGLNAICCVVWKPASRFSSRNMAERVFIEELECYLRDNIQVLAAWLLTAVTPKSCRQKRSSAIFGAGTSDEYPMPKTVTGKRTHRTERRRPGRRRRSGLEQFSHGGSAICTRPVAHHRPHQGTCALADGLDSDKNLMPGCAETGLDCLALFGQRLANVKPANVRMSPPIRYAI